MKIIGKLLKNKWWRWNTGGVMCLFAAAMLFALGNHKQASAATTIEELNQASGKIISGSELELLRNENITSGTYTLQNDITIESITSSASGVFGGTFDGNGHVVTIKDINITEEDIKNITESQISGLLFGTVTGTVRNVILDIEDADAKYTRNTSNEASHTHTEAPVYNVSNELVDVNAIHALTESTTIDGELCKVQYVSENGTRSTRYDAVENPGTDYFGLLCGKNNGTIEQVYVTGNGVATSRTTGENYSETVESGSRTVTYYYKQSESISDSESKDLFIAVDKTSTSSEISLDYGLSAKLNITENSTTDSVGTQITTYTYTLKLSNVNTIEENSTIKAKDIKILGGLSDWNGYTDGLTITTSTPVTFTKTVEQPLVSIPVTVSLVTTEYTYAYLQDKTVYGEFVLSGSTSENKNIIPEKDLYVGAIAGFSDGTISKVKQTVNLTGTNVTAIGGIAGSAAAEKLSDIYMLGKVGSDSVYIGNSSATPSNSVNTIQMNVTTVPNATNWTLYDEYSQSEGVISKVTFADLSWLVKTTPFSYSTPNTDGKITVTLGDDKKITSKPLGNIAVGYTARKSLNDFENQAYYSNTGLIELGNSGFYKVLAAYTTDGYYHYREDVSSGTIVYPYPEEGPFTFVSGSILRSKLNPLEDVVELVIESNSTNTGTVYYVVNNATAVPGMGTNPKFTSLTSQGIAIIPFKEESEQYRMAVVVNNHIYPTIESGAFSSANKLALPKPNVSVFNYYNSNGERNTYSSFGDSSSYIAGEEMIIQPYGNEISNYSFRYLFSTVAPVPGHWENSQAEAYYNNRYVGNNTEFDTLFNENALSYNDSAMIPTEFNEEQNVYLYVEVSKKNYNSAIYCYGPINISKKDVLTPVLPSSDGYTVINGDVMKINGAPQGTRIEYFVSKSPTSSYSGNWNAYSSNTGILMNESVGNYVYAKIVYDADKYSEWFEFACSFGGECAEPSITPNTGVATGDAETDSVTASSVGSITPISLSARTDKAHIFYLVSDTKQTIKLERVDTVPSGITEDGDCNQANTERYFKVGNRWYRADNVNVERYTESIHLINDTANVKLAYISAVAVADGYKISNVRNYVYRIKQAQQVANPEAALETSCSPSTEKFEVANIPLGSSLSFYSVTPESKLYYAIGSGTEEPTQEIPTGGVTVEGTYGENFVVRVQAKKEGMLPSEVITFVYKISDQEMAAAPTATPGTSAELPTVILPGNKILLSTTTKEALIYYTLDGSSPLINVSEEGIYSSGNEATKLYDPTIGIDMPEDGKDYFTITAVAVKNGLAKSAEAHFTYSFPGTVLAPYANFASGKVELNEVVLLKSLTEDAVIYYNVSFGEKLPEDPTLSSSVFNEAYPFTITQKTTIKAMAVKDNVKSEIVTFTFEPMVKLSAPTASIQSGSVVSRGTVLELKAETGATIYYTMDGSDPTDNTNMAVMQGNSLVLNGEAGAQITIKAYAVAADKSKSEVVTFTYLFSQNAGGVTASIENGSTVSNGTKVNLISDVTDGDIYYTTDGSSPVSNGKKGTTVEIIGTPGSTFTVKAVVIINGEPGTVSTFIYKIQERPDAPTASPAGGTLTVATRVTLNAGTEKIYYTTDGTEPTKSSTAYSEPILINRATTLKAIAVSEEGEISEVATFVYEAALKAASVKSSIEDGEVLEPGAQVILTTATDGAEIYYSTDGTEPNLDNLDSLLIYDGEAIEINRSVTIRAVAYRKDLRLSDVQTWSYLVEKIPAVEQKEAEAAKLAEEELKDTDASELARENDLKTDKATKTIRERKYQTAVVYPLDAFDGYVALETNKEENNPYTIKKAKGIYGDDTTVLVAYKVRVKSGSSGVQPKDDIEIAIPIPKGYEDASLTAALVKEDYNIKSLETRREAGVLYVKTDKVGSYVVIGPERSDEVEKNFPHLLVLEIAAGVVMAGGMVFIVSERIKKIKRKK